MESRYTLDVVAQEDGESFTVLPSERDMNIRFSALNRGGGSQSESNPQDYLLKVVYRSVES